MYTAHPCEIGTCLFVHLSEAMFMTPPVLVMQPHGFFNCSPAVDVPPCASEVEIKDSVVAVKPIQNGLIAKL